MVEVLAWCGAALSCLLAAPQAIRVLRTERLEGISASTYWIVLTNAVVGAAWRLRRNPRVDKTSLTDSVMTVWVAARSRSRALLAPGP
jgi:hypothetical protein